MFLKRIEYSHVNLIKLSSLYPWDWFAIFASFTWTLNFQGFYTIKQNF